MNKEGHLGVVKDTHQPIIKKIRKVERVDINQTLAKSNSKPQHNTIDQQYNSDTGSKQKKIGIRN